MALFNLSIDSILMRDYTTSYTLNKSYSKDNHAKNCGITLPFYVLGPDISRVKGPYFSFSSNTFLRDYTTLHTNIDLSVQVYRQSYCGITLPFDSSFYESLDIYSSLSDPSKAQYLRDYTAFISKAYLKQKEIDNCGITLPFKEIEPVGSLIPVFKVINNLRDYTTLSLRYDTTLSGLHYPNLRDYTTPFRSILSEFLVKYQSRRGITLPFLKLKTLKYNRLEFSNKEITESRMRDYTTFCGITLPCLGLHYLKFRYNTNLNAGLHYLLSRYNTTTKSFLMRLQNTHFKRVKIFFGRSIKLLNKTLLNYYIKHIKDFTTVQLIKQCLHSQTNLFCT